MVDLIDNRYQLIKRLGRGGMGTVYQAEDRLTRQIVALKRINLSADDLALASDTFTTDIRLALAIEFRTLAGLRHPHIISVLDYGFDAERRPYFTMELLTEAQPVTAAAIDQTRAVKLQYLYQLLLALDYLHRRSVIHRDLKPDNVLVTAGGSLKVLDFGLAQGGGSESITGASDATAGTIAYMAPELFGGQAATVQSDLYAFGLLTYELLTGHFCFDVQNVMTLVNDILRRKPDTSMLEAPIAALLDRLLAKDPSARPASALEVLRSLGAATGEPVPQESQEIRESYLAASQFVGRTKELNTLREALRSLSTGRGQSWLVGGESGVGKSRLLDELRTRALTDGVTVLRGQGTESGALPYQYWRDPVRDLLLTVEVSPLEAAVLRSLVPDIHTLTGHEVSEAPSMSGTGAQERLSLTIVDLFKRHKQPALLILEDLQWAQESLQPLKMLLRYYETLPLMIVGSYRSDESPELAETLSSMQHMPLHRLSQDEVAQLTRSMLGEAGAQAHLVERLMEETEGNAFFMVEVMRALAEEAGGLHDIGRKSLPQRVLAGGLQAVVKRRLARLPDWTAPPLRLAAVAGRSIDQRLLQAAGIDVDIDRWLRTCADYAVMEIVEDKWRFSHDKLREQVIADLTPEQAASLHRALAQAIEATYPDDPAYLEPLYEHWQAADDQERAMNYLVPLLREIVTIQASLARAIELTRPALAYLPESDPRYLQVLKHLYAVHREKYDYEQAEACAQKVLQIANNPADKAFALHALGGLHLRRRQLEKAREYGLQSLALAQESASLREQSDSYNLLAMSTHYLGRREEAMGYYQKSLELARTNEDDYGVMLASNNMALLASDQGDYSTALANFERTLALARRIGARMGIAGSLVNIGSIKKFQKHYDEAERYFQESLQIFETIQLLQGVAIALSHLGTTATFQGNYDRGREYLERSLAVTADSEDRYTHGSSLNDFGYNRFCAGDIERARQIWQQTLIIAHEIRDSPLMLDVLMGFAELHEHDGTHDEARRLAALLYHHPLTKKETRSDRLMQLLYRLDIAAPDDVLPAPADPAAELEACVTAALPKPV